MQPKNNSNEIKGENEELRRTKRERRVQEGRIDLGEKLAREEGKAQQMRFCETDESGDCSCTTASFLFCTMLKP